MDTTGLTSGTVYPALDKLESLGYLTSHWEDVRAARRDKRPPRRYFDLTGAGRGTEALQDSEAGIARRVEDPPARGMRERRTTDVSLLRLLLAIINTGW